MVDFSIVLHPFLQILLGCSLFCEQALKLIVKSAAIIITIFFIIFYAVNLYSFGVIPVRDLKLPIANDAWMKPMFE